VFCGLLFAFFSNGTFSNVKMNVKIGICAAAASDLQSGGIFHKVGVNFPGNVCTFHWKRSVTTLLEKCFADCC